MHKTNTSTTRTDTHRRHARQRKHSKGEAGKVIKRSKEKGSHLAFFLLFTLFFFLNGGRKSARLAQKAKARKCALAHTRGEHSLKGEKNGKGSRHTSTATKEIARNVEHHTLR